MGPMGRMGLTGRMGPFGVAVNGQLSTINCPKRLSSCIDGPLLINWGHQSLTPGSLA